VFGGGAGAEECGGWGYGGVEVVVGDGEGGEGVVWMALEALGMGLVLRSAGVICFDGYRVVVSASLAVGLYW